VAIVAARSFAYFFLFFFGSIFFFFFFDVRSKKLRLWFPLWWHWLFQYAYLVAPL
jgi:hypothetical protein